MLAMQANAERANAEAAETRAQMAALQRAQQATSALSSGQAQMPFRLLNWSVVDGSCDDSSIDVAAMRASVSGAVALRKMLDGAAPPLGKYSGLASEDLDAWLRQAPLAACSRVLQRRKRGRWLVQHLTGPALEWWQHREASGVA